MDGIYIKKEDGLDHVPSIAIKSENALKNPSTEGILEELNLHLDDLCYCDNCTKCEEVNIKNAHIKNTHT